MRTFFVLVMSIASVNLFGQVTTPINKNFVVVSNKTYLHTQCLPSTKKMEFITKGVTGSVLDQKDGFVLVSFKNFKGQQVINWVDSNDVSFLSASEYTALIVEDKTFQPTDCKVAVKKAYFYHQPNSSYRSNKFLPSGATLYGEKRVNGFVYTSFSSPTGVVTTGWLQASDIVASH
jgi:hypothetical protein